MCGRGGGGRFLNQIMGKLLSCLIPVWRPRFLAQQEAMNIIRIAAPTLSSPPGRLGSGSSGTRNKGSQTKLHSRRSGLRTFPTK